jgi:hypothetical protein
VQFEFGEVLQIVTLVTLVAGFLFGAMELRHARRARVEKGALDVLGIAIKPEHIHASYAILELPQDAGPELIAESEELKRAANTLMVLYEYLGNLVYQRIVPLQTLDLLVGGIVRACWRRMRPYIEDQREKRNLPNIAEWFQWLAERLEQYGRPEKSLGAHVAYRDWRP